MSQPQFEEQVTTPSTPVQAREAPQSEGESVARFDLFARRTLGAGGGVLHPKAHAASLAHASGGQLARIGPALLQLQRDYGNRYTQQVVEQAQSNSHAARAKKNDTGLPDHLKAGIENLSGLSLDDVRVHFNSARPAQLQALAYTQGTEIHVGPGQEQHLAHEAWHVVQQMRGRVQTKLQAKGVVINDDPVLEREADRMGEKAAAQQSSCFLPVSQGKSETNEAGFSSPSVAQTGKMPIMRKLGFEYELGGITPKKDVNWTSFFGSTWKQMNKGEIIEDKGAYQITADVAEGGSNNLEFITRPFDERDPGEVATLDAVANSILDDIKEMRGKPLSTDIPLKQFNRISGSSSIYIHVKDSNPKGQIQMTGGVDPVKLSGLMSGQELGAIPEGKISEEDTPRVMPLQKYYQIGLEGPAMGLVYGIALNSVRTLFDEVKPAGQEMLAAAGALMAQLIIEHRVQPFEVSGKLESAGRFIAKTDHAMLLQLIDERIKDKIEWARFPEVVLSTAQSLVDRKALQEHEKVSSLTLKSPVFPPYYKVTGGISFTDLTIGRWVETALPKGRKPETEEVYEDYGYTGMFVERKTGRMIPVGRDLLTQKHYPGTTQQRKELGAYGAYGSKTDPGEKVILEWRDLTSWFYPDLLPKVMVALFKYYSDIGFSGLYRRIEKYIPAYRSLVMEMPPGPHREEAIKHYNFALYCFKSSIKKTYGEAQTSLSIAQKYFDKAHDQVIEERMERERAARYSNKS